MGTYKFTDKAYKTKLGAVLKPKRKFKSTLRIKRKLYMTKRRKTDLFILRALLVSMAIIAVVNTFSVPNRITVNGGTVSAIPTVERETVEASVHNDLASLPALIESPEMEEILKYKWKNITPQQAYDIIACESSFRNIKNPTSTASGKWQFTASTWEDGVKARNLNWTLYDRFDFEKATNMAHWYIEVKNQLGRWDCAKILNFKKY